MFALCTASIAPFKFFLNAKESEGWKIKSRAERVVLTQLVFIPCRVVNVEGYVTKDTEIKTLNDTLYSK